MRKDVSFFSTLVFAGVIREWCNNNDWSKDVSLDNKSWEENWNKGSETLFSTTYFRGFWGECKKSPLSVCNIKESPSRVPNLDPTEYGWCKDEETKSLQPVTLPPSKLPAPYYIPKLVCCSCASEKPCHSSRCGCVVDHLACTAFCHCQGSSICKSELTRAIIEESNEDEYQEPISWPKQSHLWHSFVYNANLCAMLPRTNIMIIYHPNNVTYDIIHL